MCGPASPVRAWSSPRRSRPGTGSKSRRFAVTIVRPWCRAVAAMRRSGRGQRRAGVAEGGGDRPRTAGRPASSTGRTCRAVSNNSRSVLPESLGRSTARGQSRSLRQRDRRDRDRRPPYCTNLLVHPPVDSAEMRGDGRWCRGGRPPLIPRPRNSSGLLPREPAEAPQVSSTMRFEVVRVLRVTPRDVRSNTARAASGSSTATDPGRADGGRSRGVGLRLDGHPHPAAGRQVGGVVQGDGAAAVRGGGEGAGVRGHGRRAG